MYHSSNSNPSFGQQSTSNPNQNGFPHQNSNPNQNGFPQQNSNPNSNGFTQQYYNQMQQQQQQQQHKQRPSTLDPSMLLNHPYSKEEDRYVMSEMSPLSPQVDSLAGSPYGKCF
jgi:hypothetical protein